MISLRFFVLILLTLCCREVAGSSPSLEFGRSLLAISSMTIGFAVMTKMVAFFLVSRSINRGQTTLFDVRATFQKHRRNIERAWCVAMPLLLLTSGWFAWMEHMHLQGWPQGILVLTTFLPTIVFLALAEMTSAQLDELFYDGSSHWEKNHQVDLDATEMSDVQCPSAQSGWVKHWFLRMRLGDMAGLVTCLFPVLLLASLSDASRWAEQNMGEFWWWAKIPLGIAAVLGFIAIFPALLTRWSGGIPVPLDLKGHLKQLMDRARVTGVDPRVIPSQRRWSGAAIVGWFPGLRHLWLGDALIQGLDPRQLDMVVFHELAHVRRMHYLWRMLPVVLAMMIASVLWAVGAHFELTQSMAFKFLVGLLAGLILIVGIGVIARYCELDADRTACDLAVASVDWTSVRSPAEELAGALSLLLDESSCQAATWLHPSLSQRLSSLAQWQPAGVTSFSRAL